MRRLVSGLVMGTLLLSTGLALAADPVAPAGPSAVKVKKTYKAKTVKPAKAKTAGLGTPTQKPM